MAETYKLELYASGPYVGCSSTEECDLIEYGYTDEEWDDLSERERENLLDEWSEENFWNNGYEFNGRVIRG